MSIDVRSRTALPPPSYVPGSYRTADLCRTGNVRYNYLIKRRRHIEREGVNMGTIAQPRFSTARERLPSDALVEFMRREGTSRRLERGETLDDGAMSNDVCHMTEGWVIRRRHVDDDHCGIVGTYMPGDFIDLDQLVEARISDQLEALVDIEYLTLPANALREAVREHSDIAFAIMRRLVAEADWLREGLTAIGQFPSAYRLLIYIAQTRRRMIAFGNLTREAKTMPFPLTQAQLAEALGVSAIHANRTVAALRNDFGVTFRARRVWLADLTAFEAEAARVMG